MDYPGKMKWTAGPVSSVALRYGLALVSVAAALGLGACLRTLPFASTFRCICAFCDRYYFLVCRHRAWHSCRGAVIARPRLFSSNPTPTPNPASCMTSCFWSLHYS